MCVMNNDASLEEEEQEGEEEEEEEEEEVEGPGWMIRIPFNGFIV